MVFQDYALFPHMSVAENVGYGLKLARVGREEAARQVKETMGFLGLSGLEGRSPNELSGGQQQRVALARALVMKPEVLLLDEPLSNLDAKLRVSIRGELTSIQRQLGLTTIYVTHDQDEALAMSDWIAVMNRGRVIQWGTPWEIYYQPRTAFMADFVGSVNLVRVPVLSADTDVLQVRLGDATMAVPVEDTVAASGEALLCIRPESLSFGGPGEMAPDGYVAIPGTVVRRTFLGHLLRYVVRVAVAQDGEESAEWVVDQPDPGGAPIREDAVTVQLNPRRVHVIPELDAPAAS